MRAHWELEAITTSFNEQYEEDVRDWEFHCPVFLQVDEIAECRKLPFMEGRRNFTDNCTVEYIIDAIHSTLKGEGEEKFGVIPYELLSQLRSSSIKEIAEARAKVCKTNKDDWNNCTEFFGVRIRQCEADMDELARRERPLSQFANSNSTRWFESREFVLMLHSPDWVLQWFAEVVAVYLCLLSLASFVFVFRPAWALKSLIIWCPCAFRYSFIYGQPPENSFKVPYICCRWIFAGADLGGAAAAAAKTK